MAAVAVDMAVAEEDAGAAAVMAAVVVADMAVAAAAMATAATAVIEKMLRVMMLAPFLLWLSAHLRGDAGDGAPTSTRRLVIPWFAVLFVAVSGVNSLNLLPAPWVHGLVQVDTALLAMAMAALGLRTHAGAIRQAAAPARMDGRERVDLEVHNASTHVVRVSSHYPFERVNRRLEFDRAKATGCRLDIEAGSTERWAPGETRTVRLVRVR